MTSSPLILAIGASGAIHQNTTTPATLRRYLQNQIPRRYPTSTSLRERSGCLNHRSRRTRAQRPFNTSLHIAATPPLTSNHQIGPELSSLILPSLPNQRYRRQYSLHPQSLLLQISTQLPTLSRLHDFIHLLQQVLIHHRIQFEEPYGWSLVHEATILQNIAFVRDQQDYHRLQCSISHLLDLYASQH